MAIKESVFPNDPQKKFLEDWRLRLQKVNGNDYEALDLPTQYGPTRVYRMGAQNAGHGTVTLLPGFRTCGHFWDLTNRMRDFARTHQVVLVDVIGQPSMSSGRTPPVKEEGYNHWLEEVLNGLRLQETYLTGASFGCQLSLKFSGYAPQRVKGAFLVAPAGFNNIGARMFSNLRSAWYNTLPMISPKRKNIDSFLRTMIFTGRHMPPPAQYDLTLDYFGYVLKNFRNGAQLPYRMTDEELRRVQAPIHLLVGDKDPLISAREVKKRAESLLPNLAGLQIVPDHAHGMETADAAFGYMLEKIG